jgi:signal transduction histidine kinase
MATFTVDTHLFRELGELLVGRDSTALVELIKNSYDADATEVVVYGEALSSTARGFIQIRDNGIGMNRREFENGFLRIAARTKVESNRRSVVFSRRYTGAKGIGRLAAHKLARFLEISSARWNQRTNQHKLLAGSLGLEATIDWDEIEKKKTLDELDSSNAIVLNDEELDSGSPAGTTITLRRLRRAWTSTQHGRFLEEIQAFEPPSVLASNIPSRVVSEELLFDRPKLRDAQSSTGSLFSVKLEGELAPAEDFWAAIIDAAHWVIEVDADRASGTVRFAIAPTSLTLKLYPNAEIRTFEIDHPSPKTGPFFQARILKRTGVQLGRADIRQWAGRSSGIRVYMEGFRILPYGEARNDWLSIDRDATERDRGVIAQSEPRDLVKQLNSDEEEDIGLLIVPNKHYFGGVFLTERGAPTLEMLVNREGFIPNEGYETLARLVRMSVDLCTRVQAAATKKTRNERRELRASQKPPEDGTRPHVAPISFAIESAVEEAKQHAAQAKRLASSGKIAAASRELEQAVTRVEKIAGASEEIADENAMVRVLASVGAQLASFIHEINGLVDIARGVDQALRRIRESVGLSPKHKTALGALQRSVGDLRRMLERQASYLVDVVSPDARRRRSRQSLSRRFDSAAKLVAFAADKRNIKIVNQLTEDLRSPPMFPAELTAVFSNLLTNAIKAAGRKGRIRVSGKQGRDQITVRLENTGKAVRLREAERWFQPFESSTVNVDPVLGQGMGLGLPITRSMLEEYGATIKFAPPTAGFATAIEIVFPS